MSFCCCISLSVCTGVVALPYIRHHLFNRNNFLRLNILKVLQLTDKHLQKIISVDEFIRRIYSVMHSNDSLARGVTLR